MPRAVMGKFRRNLKYQDFEKGSGTKVECSYRNFPETGEVLYFAEVFLLYIKT